MGAEDEASNKIDDLGGKAKDAFKVERVCQFGPSLGGEWRAERIPPNDVKTVDRENSRPLTMVLKPERLIGVRHSRLSPAGALGPPYRWRTLTSQAPT